MFAIRAQEKKIAFVFKSDLDVANAVWGDEKRLRQVLINLLGNAIKFTEQGCVTFTVNEYQDRLRFQVEDTGRGIESADLNRIFSPFQQVSPAENKAEGTGLGLSISQHLIGNMGSTLHVESQFGQGSKFWFDLPLPVVEGWRDPVQEPAIVGYKGKKRRVLVVDDRAENRTMLYDMLTRLGFEITLAADGQEAVRRSEEVQPDIIFMDLVMPLMDGFAATRQIRQMGLQNGFGSKVVIIAVSASAFDDDADKSLAAGCDDFIAKTYTNGTTA